MSSSCVCNTNGLTFVGTAWRVLTWRFAKAVCWPNLRGALYKKGQHQKEAQLHDRAWHSILRHKGRLHPSFDLMLVRCR